MMKIAHFSDLHYSVPNLQEADKTFGFAVTEAIELEVDLGIISGDSTDLRLDAHSPALMALAKRIKQLADHCPVLILQGTFSHEPVGIIQILGMIGAKHPIFIADKIGMVGLFEGKWEEYDPGHQHNPQYDVVISTLPTVNKADLLTLVEPSTINEEMGNYVADILASFAGINAKLRANGIPTVLVSHGTVSGSMNESGVPMAGTDHEFTIGALFAANADAVMLGHIHLQQCWERDFQNVHQVIAYPGSIGRFHYGEIGEKYFLSWSVQPGYASYDAIITPSRKMIDIEFTGVPDLEELARVAKDCEGAYVRVRYEVDEEFMKQIDRNAIKEILSLSSEVKVEGSVLTVQRQRCAGISKVTSLEDRFLQWCELTNTPIDGLIERLNKLQNTDSKELAHDIVRNKMSQSEFLAAA